MRCHKGTFQGPRYWEGWKRDGARKFQEIEDRESCYDHRSGIKKVFIIAITLKYKTPALYTYRCQKPLNNGANNSNWKTSSAATKFMFTCSTLFNSQKTATTLYDSALIGKYSFLGKINMYVLGLLTTAHLKVFTVNLEALLVPGNSLWKAVTSLRLVAGWAACSSSFPLGTIMISQIEELVSPRRERRTPKRH